MRQAIFEYMHRYDYENLLICQEASLGLKAVIAIHDTTLGPAAGGTRMWTYADEMDAIEDALRLARGMTYKYAAAGLNLGGGKCVVIGDPKVEKTESLFRALGRFIHRLNGVYLTGEDVGTTLRDMEYLRLETPYVITLPSAWGGAGPVSPATAFGVVQAMRACLEAMYGTDSLQGRRVAVQGLGAVGSEVIPLLHERGAELVVSDIDAARVESIRQNFPVEVVESDRIHAVPADVYCPCALGATLNDRTIPEMQAKLVCGSANNQLKEERHGLALKQRGIFYAPDYIANAGGTTWDTDRLGPGGHNPQRAQEKVARIFENMKAVLQIAAREDIPTSEAADRLAERRIAAVRQAKSLAKAGTLLHG